MFYQEISPWIVVISHLIGIDEKKNALISRQYVSNKKKKYQLSITENWAYGYLIQLRIVSLLDSNLGNSRDFSMQKLGIFSGPCWQHCHDG